MIDRGLTMDLLHNLIIRIDKSSFPCTLLMLRSLINLKATSSLKENDENLVVEIYCSELGTVILLTRGVQCT